MNSEPLSSHDRLNKQHFNQSYNYYPDKKTAYEHHDPESLRYAYPQNLYGRRRRFWKHSRFTGRFYQSHSSQSYRYFNRRVANYIFLYSDSIRFKKETRKIEAQIIKKMLH